MLAGSELVQIDEDELLEELSALIAENITVDEVVKDEGVIEIDGEKIELPSVPKDIIEHLHESDHEHETERQNEREKELIAE